MEKSNKFLMFLIPVLTLLGFLSTVVWLIVSFRPDSGLGTGIAILSVIAYIVAIVYALVGYKKPHGNMLRHTFIVFAISLALYADKVQLSQVGTVALLINAVCTVPVAYMAGRLHKFDQNKALLYLVVVMLLIAGLIDFLFFTKNTVPGIGGFVFGVLKFSTFNKFILGLALATAYVSRFRTHKEAGLLDDEKKK